ncbi:MAG TPA: chitobiase/beta-hexosaminidase C-terminal domain-containing protein [Verrucomicrobiales bacterium]|nr:chitobiase/beta-hexosaminidase C-terminal domain-containing protein [Verrucomicrobiales bacterium]
MKAITCVKVWLALFVTCAGLSIAQNPPAPSWWLDRGAVTAGASNDFAMVNTGQARFFVQQALRESTFRVPRLLSRGEYAFYNSVLTLAAPGIRDFAAITTGELRALLSPLQLDWGNRIPLPANVNTIAPAPNDFSPVNIGQLKTMNFFSYYGAPAVAANVPVISEVLTGANGFIEIANLTGANIAAPSDYYIVLDVGYRDGNRPDPMSGFSLPSAALASQARIQVSPANLLTVYVPGTNLLTDCLRIVEIMYNSKGNDTLEYVVLRNFGAVAQNIAGVRFVGSNAGGDGAPDFTFPGNQPALAPGGIVVLTNLPAAFTARFPQIPGGSVVSWLNALQPLSNAGETLTIFTPAPGPVQIQAVTYDDTTPWPTAADGEGASLVIRDPGNLAAGGANWVGIIGGNPQRLPLPPLATSGQYLSLYLNDNTREQEFFPALPDMDLNATQSFNLDDNAVSATTQMAWTFAAPTPAAVNNAGTLSVTSPPVISVSGGGAAVDAAGRGVIAGAGGISITLSHPKAGISGSEIRYTLDGQDPRGGTAATYTGAISRSATTVLRAVLRMPAGGAGYAFSDPACATFVYAQQVNTQTLPAGVGNMVGAIPLDYQIDPDMPAARLPDFQAGLTSATVPSLFFTLNPADIVDPDNTTATLGLFTPDAVPRPVPAHMEFYDPANPANSVATRVRLEASGDSTISWGVTRKKSMKISLGNSEDSGIAADFFGDGLSWAGELQIKGGGHDTWHVAWGTQFYENATYLTDQMAGATLRAMKDTFLPGQVPDASRIIQPRTRTVQVYINGLYWGVYFLFDRASTSWAATQTDRVDDDFDMRDDGFEASLYTLNGVNQEAYIDYVLTGLFLSVGDWPGNNNRTVWQKNPALAQMHFFHWGSEYQTMELATDVDPAPNGTPPRWNDIPRAGGVPSNPGGAVTLFFNSRLNAGFRALVLQRLNANCFGSAPLSPAGLLARFNALAAVFAPLAICESARWGDGYSTVPADVAYGPASTNAGRALQWDTAINRARRFIQVYPQQCFQWLRDLFGYTLVELPAYPPPPP